MPHVGLVIFIISMITEIELVPYDCGRISFIVEVYVGDKRSHGRTFIFERRVVSCGFFYLIGAVKQKSKK